ncbi:DUF3841 domain-containing protein [Parafannyhessea umbonata]|uniref:DUF3841 domain-containing protein n=1 Tax=Parafannyhessea umbonata TaxID=604330 RepID=A0A6N7XAM4_9ACTN|nr:DUF3841 domain-containing protein [Parafannyhessea umbonata]MCI7219844.1 DUF3841 domain-containing protein [Parafannyhessea umbonata]MDD7199675.1 DUF3841 domain-containing protein [Parafannyhessea umbonata]MDY4418882.1 DUF3841 domain-containing protein [Parafannyhessea umbonata]MST60464.1 DUF3841 domain-containing protein [Parafannyhessea umbonata]
MAGTDASGSRTVWTRQVPSVADELERGVTYRARAEYVRIKNDTIADYYLGLYRWLAQGCKRRGLLRGDAEDPMPIWVALTPGTRLGAVEGTVSLTLEVPASELTVLDYEKWGYRVNGWYLPRDREDERRFNDELARLGIGDESSLVLGEKGNFYPAQRMAILRSWDRLFDDGPNQSDEHNVGVLWQIRREWVREIERYD